MLRNVCRADLHRVFLFSAVDPVDRDLFTLPFVTDCSQSNALRARLHQALGRQLGGYRLTVDIAQQSALVCLHLHRYQIASVMRTLANEFPRSRFGRVVRLTGNEKVAIPPLHAKSGCLDDD